MYVDMQGTEYQVCGFSFLIHITIQGHNPYRKIPALKNLFDELSCIFLLFLITSYQVLMSDLILVTKYFQFQLGVR